MSLHCLHSEIITLADPAAVLSHDIITGRFAARPTVIIRGDTLHTNDAPALVAATAPHVKAMVGDIPALRTDFRRAAAPTVAETIDNVLKLHVLTLCRSAYADGTPVPGILIDRDIVTVAAPAADYRIDNLLHGRGVMYDSPLHDSSIAQAARYQALCHELAHAAGADEPQADHTAAVMTARAYSGTPCNAMMADIRAVMAVDSALSVIASAPEHNIYANDDLEEYGWKMVDAGDSARADAADIISGGPAPAFGGDKTAILSLARILHDCALARPGKPAAAAQQTALMQECAGQTAAVQAIAARYGEATTRLENGFAAYRGMACA
jgi:hypothetical protein